MPQVFEESFFLFILSLPPGLFDIYWNVFLPGPALPVPGVADAVIPDQGRGELCRHDQAQGVWPRREFSRQRQRRTNCKDHLSGRILEGQRTNLLTLFCGFYLHFALSLNINFMVLVSTHINMRLIKCRILRVNISGV